ncbi:MAG: DUF5686 and carboxypeptidase regulatory-like domain-containing protein [Brumimicrobium sp.]
MKGLFILLFIFITISSQSQVLRGTINDLKGEPVPFVKVHLKNSSYGTFANSLGKFQIELEKGTHNLIFTASGYNKKEVSVTISKEESKFSVELTPEVQDLDEVTIVYRSERDRGKEIMKKVIDKRSHFQGFLNEYSTDTYCFSSLEKDQVDDIHTDSIIGKEKLNLMEWRAVSHYKKPNRYKDEFYAYQDFMETKDNLNSTSVGISIDGLDDNFVPTTSIEQNPYLFINGIKDFNFSIFDNSIAAPKVTKSPLVSPLAFNAFIYYIFHLENMFVDKDGNSIHEIRVKPRFEVEPLFEGTIYIRKDSWEVDSYEFSINPKAMHYFKNMTIVCDYSKVGEKLVPTRREFIYTVKEGRSTINGLIRLKHSDYSFEVDDSKRKFWLETSVYDDKAFDRDSAYWNENRPIKLKSVEKQFISEQDSILNYRESEEYMRKKDSVRNQITFLNVLFGGVGHVNSFKGYEFYLPGLINQVVPFGVGGYRHKLDPTYSKTFDNGNQLSLSPSIDYGFRNEDVKGGLRASFMYNPLNFSRIEFMFGDVYDFVTTNQNIQGTLAPANRVRNQKLEINYRQEYFNGFYAKTTLHYSDRQSIDNIEYPEWVEVFGMFQDPQPFNRYKILLATIDIEYHFRQRYIIKKGRKYVLDTPWPTIKFQYKKAIPSIFGSEAEFDYVEIRVHDEIDFKRYGKSEINFKGGAFLQKKDLRIIEHKFFRPSDQYFFSNPTTTMQLLDTALNTSNSYYQLNFIHNFNGYFLNKIWLINRLKLEESIGGGILMIPDANFAQIEFFVGLQRMFRIKKQVFKLGVFAATQSNTLDAASINLKFGFNLYDSFRDKWNY